MSQISDDNYFVINGWMINKLSLSNAELMVFAIIYGFCQHDKCGGNYHGSLQYLADFTGTTRPTIIKALKSLAAKGYIEKSESYQNNVKFCAYKINLTVIKNLTGSKNNCTGGKEILPQGGKEILPQGGKEILPNNINIDNLPFDNKKIKKRTGVDIVSEYTQNETLRQAIFDFVEQRKASKSPMTDRALSMLLTKLDSLARTDNEKIAILNESIINGWKSVYPLKGGGNNGNRYGTNSRYDADSQRLEAERAAVYAGLEITQL